MIICSSKFQGSMDNSRPEVRDDLTGQNLSFTEIAKLVGKKWQKLLPSEKEPYEAQALASKQRYPQELANYKKTCYFLQHSQYMLEFKITHGTYQGK